jgi:Ca2+-transporting ATPase
VSKQSAPVDEEEAGIGDRHTMVFTGTAVTHGRGRAVVVATGMNTEFGRIAGLLQNVKEKRTPLQENLDRVGHTLAHAALIIVAFIAVLGILRGESLVDVLLFAIALAVAVVPEALPAVVTISLAIGVQRMVRRHALVRRLSAVETLGCTSIICSDKTGTLTKDEMTVRCIVVAGATYTVKGAGYEPEGGFMRDGSPVDPPGDLREFLHAGLLCGDAHLVKIEESWDIKGDPTEGAIVVAAAKAGLEKEDIEGKNPRVFEISFTSERKRMTTLHRSCDGLVAYTKGAPEMVLPVCTRVLVEGGGEEELTENRRAVLLEHASTMGAQAMRVLAIARKTGATERDAESNSTLLGLVGMIDPPRPEARVAIQECRDAGIAVRMITGDHPVTAEAIARELQILTDGKVVTGAELDRMEEDEFAKAIDHIQVYARVAPSHKLRVVTTLQARGDVVAMTGDGVNDAPALKRADIGIAMGVTGTDVSKEAAAMTLTDDNFASIVAAVEEGRAIFGNIKKYLMYLLSANIGEILLMGIASILALPLPLSPVQILTINLVTDGLPALALALDPPEKDLMHRHPRNPRIGIFTRPVVGLMLIGGVWSALMNLAVFLVVLDISGPAQAMTMVFVALTMTEFFKAYAFRSDRHTTFHRPFANHWLNLAVFSQIAILFLLIYTDMFHRIFGTESLSVHSLGLAFLAAATILPVLEIGKWTVRRGWFGEAR